MQSRIICSLEIHNRCKWSDCNMGKKPRTISFLHIPYRCKIEQVDIRQGNGMKNSEMVICTRK